MSSTQAPHFGRRFAVVGGGIAGLSAAHRLVELAPDAQVTLFESSERLGGALHSVRQDDFLLEFGADQLITNVPWGVDLCRRIGFTEQLIETRAEGRRACVVRDGVLHPVPAGFMLMEPRALWPVMRSPLLSVRGKIRLLAEYFVRARQDGGDESLASFARRRLGQEAFERLVQPLAAGIYTADPERLSMTATMPRFLEMERHHGGLIRAVRHAQSRKTAADAEADSGARYSLFVTPCQGMQSLVEALAARLPEGAVKLRAAVTSIAQNGAGLWDVTAEGASPQTFDAVVLATGAHHTAELVRNLDAELAVSLAAIPYASSAVVVAGYQDSQFARPLDCFGFVVPEVEGRPILAASFSSVKFSNRAPQGCALVRTFLGGSARPELVDASDEELRGLAHAQLAELLGIRGGALFAHVRRWRRAMPQYHLGHLELVAKITGRVNTWPGLALAGNAFHGVGIPHCIHSGELAAERLLAECVL